jgi:hypothetical protein
MCTYSWLGRSTYGKKHCRRKRTSTPLAFESLEDRTVPTLFGPPVPFPTGQGPGLVAVGDFLAGSGPDIAVVDSANAATPAVVRLLANDGRGGYSLSLAGMVGKEPGAIVAAAFTHSGHLDLAVTNEVDNSLSVLLGDGHGNFSPADGALFTGGDGPTDLTVADFDGDGNADLAVINSGSQNVTILRGHGDGSFTADTILSGLGDPHGLSLGDFNGDGRLDLAVAIADPSGKVQILLNEPDGFHQGASLPVGKLPFAVAQVDVNSDGLPDLVTANWTGGDMSVLLGKGGDQFQPAVNYPIGLSPDKLSSGDFNGDGHPDVVVSFVGGLAVELGDGHGGFSPAAGSPVLSTLGIPPVAVGDFNGDGAPDLVSTDFTSQALVLLNHSPTTTTMTSSAPRAGFSQPVTFTATVSPTIAGSGVPTGSITFMDAGVPLATVLLDGGGHATFTTTALAAGSHTITARYNGDAGFRAAVTALTETVADTGDVTPQMSVTLGRFHGGRQMVTLRSTGTEALHGPFWLVLGGLGRHLRVRHRAGLTQAHAPLHSPFVAIPLPGNVLDPGATVSVLLRFASTSKAHYQPVVLAGPGAL